MTIFGHCYGVSRPMNIITYNGSLVVYVESLVKRGNAKGVAVIHAHVPIEEGDLTAWSPR